MIRISLKVGRNGERFDVTVWAASIADALDLARFRYPDGEIEVVFPIGGEDFFVRDTTAVAKLDGPGGQVTPHRSRPKRTRPARRRAREKA